MPIYPYKCTNCGYEFDKIAVWDDYSHTACPECTSPAKRGIGTPAFVKFKGEGGYPSRRKFVKGTAPGTTRSTKVWGEHDPSDKSINYMGTKK